MGYKCRIAGVFLLLLASVAALVAVAVIQDTWRFKEYSEEVKATRPVELICTTPVIARFLIVY